jgi:hypothetical protein
MIHPDRLTEMRIAVQRHGPANCWTGTSGTLAGMVAELLREREELLATVEEHEQSKTERGE